MSLEFPVLNFDDEQTMTESEVHEFPIEESQDEVQGIMEWTLDTTRGIYGGIYNNFDSELQVKDTNWVEGNWVEEFLRPTPQVVLDLTVEEWNNEVVDLSGEEDEVEVQPQVQVPRTPFAMSVPIPERPFKRVNPNVLEPEDRPTAIALLFEERVERLRRSERLNKKSKH